MEQVTQAIRAHHRELAEILNAQNEALAGTEDDAGAYKLVEFLENDLLPHARGEEGSLYPAMDKLVRDHARPTATMSIDHEAIGDYVARIKATAHALYHAPADERPELRRQLSRLGLQLQALFEVHLQKEERVYLPLMEQYLTQEEQEALLTGMHEGGQVPA